MMLDIALLMSIAILLGFSMLFWAIARKSREGFVAGFAIASVVLYASGLNKFFILPAIILVAIMFFAPILRGGEG